MPGFITRLLLEISRDERGVTLVEYGIAVTLAILLGAGAFALLATEIGAAMDAAGAKMPN